MFATTGPSVGATRRRRCSTSLATARASTPSITWTAIAGVLQADAFAGFNRLYAPDATRPGPLVEAACWSHARRKFFVLADVAAKARGRLPVLAPLAIEAVRRIDALFAVEREINGLDAAEPARRTRCALGRACDRAGGLDAGGARESVGQVEVAKAIDYMLKRWPSFTRFLDDGRICLSNNAAERAMRGIATRRSFCPPSSSI